MKSMSKFNFSLGEGVFKGEFLCVVVGVVLVVAEIFAVVREVSIQVSSIRLVCQLKRGKLGLGLGHRASPRGRQRCPRR